jgi:phosphatidylserine/phosphatidylglycerophosphate/cardiolipin synthase-like enzyme
MATIQALINQYFVGGADVGMAGERVPDPDPLLVNQVVHLIDGDEYFGAISKEIDALTPGGASSPFFYFANWWLGLVDGPATVVSGPGSLTSAWTEDFGMSGLKAFSLDDGSGGPFPPMIDRLETMSKNGVDVRGFIWVHPLLLDFPEKAASNGEFRGLWSLSVHSLLSVQALQKRQGMADKVVLNTLAHTLAGMHLKMVICGDGSGIRSYISGLDLVTNRIAGWAHPPGRLWHDVGVKAEGPGAVAIYNYYKLLWEEQLSRSVRTFRVGGKAVKSHSSDTPAIPVRGVPALAGPATQHVQVLRTAPQMHFNFGQSVAAPIGCVERLVTGFRQSPLSFAPDGIFEFRAGIKKAISGASQYVYIEDQSFWSQEIMDWINGRLKAQPAMKVVLVYGGDPADPPNELQDSAIDHLIAGIATPMTQIAFYKRGRNITVHSKLTIIDDQWAAVGSANCMRRSLYTDGECSIGVLDEATPTFAQKLRKDLWGEICGIAPGAGRDVLLNLANGLTIWDNSWGPLPAVAVIDAAMERMNLPFEYADPPGPGQWKGTGKPSPPPQLFDQLDPDSRNEY